MEYLLATCHTEGCDNAGHAVSVPAYALLDDVAHPVERVICGVCGQDVDDVVPDPGPTPDGG